VTAEDRTCLGYWFPKLEAAGVPVPETRIVRTEMDLSELLDGQTPDGFQGFLDELLWAGNEVGGRPFFLRTGHGSGKHEWRRTCYVDEGNLGWHVAALVEWSHTTDIFGLPHQVWVVRRLLDTVPLFICEGYDGFPVTREFRVFIRDDEIECVLPYWPPDAVEQGKPDREDWRKVLADAARLSDDDAEQLGHLAGLASGAVGGGYWSVDCLQTRDGGWYVTDMADGDRSFRWDPAEAAL
jgi:hypothetical protein